MSSQAHIEATRLSQERRNRRQAALLSGLLFTVVVGVCFFLTAFTIQDPPPGDQFVAVGFADLGNVEEAGGTTESEAPSETIQEAEQEAEAASEPTPEVPEVSDIVETQAESDVPVNKDSEPEPVRVDRTAHLFQNPGNSSAGGGGSQGSSEGTGNEGEETGRIEGRGLVSGDFGDAMLNGGTMIGEPKLTERPTISGLVRINIVVDASGTVIQARYDGGDNSTITDSYHIRLAERAAKSAKFSADPIRPRRTGFITIRFDLE